MFMDINTYVGHWPFRNIRYNTLAGLDELARRYGVTHMVVANVNGFFYKDCDLANDELLEELASYKGETVFLPMAVVNPTYPAWEKAARAAIQAGFKGFELSPIYHNYSLAPEVLPDSYKAVQVAAPVMALAQELGVPVRICASIENFRGRSHMDNYNNVTGDAYAALLARFPEVHVLCTSFLPAYPGEKLSALLKTRKNTYFDMTQGETFHSAIPAKVMNNLTKEQLCFGSLSPFAYMESALLKLEFTKEFDPEAMKTAGFRAFGM